MNKHPVYKTWIEINQKSLRNNIRAFRSLLKKQTKLFAVVKSNAYGHGLTVFAGLADRFGVDGFCVDSVIEGNALRSVGIRKPILVLGPTLPHLLKEAAAQDITVTVSNFDALKAIRDSKASVGFHLKIDSGMHRQGFYLEDMPKVIKFVKNSIKNPSGKNKNLLRGIYTHFAAAKDITYKDYTLKQIDILKRAKQMLARSGLKNIMVHSSATGGTVLYPQAHFDLVRIGIGLYGYWPSREAMLQHHIIWHKNITLKPVLSWRALVSEIKQLKKGDFVGYDLTAEARKPMETAVVPIGYWHGFPRSLSGCGEAIIKGSRVPIFGRVSMDLIVLGIPPHGIKTNIGDTVTFIGEEGRESIDAREFAERAGTISYEILTRLNPLMKREVI
ncbi:alanine racemase [Candidatus Jorgensenbacteria bacterium]|nr:alanine racemase [Candidatus Jorgensenbacteria bacterium]